MNGTVNPNNTKNNSSAKIITNSTPAQTALASGTTQKVPPNASSVINNSSTRQPNGDVHSPATSKGKKPGQPAMDPSEMHEMLQNRIAALEGEKVQGGEDDKRSGRDIVCGLTSVWLITSRDASGGGPEDTQRNDSAAVTYKIYRIGV
jgi:hypothetical protein